MSNAALKVAIVGAKAERQAAAFPWKESALPNVTDYDAAILDLRTLASDSSGMSYGAILKFSGLLVRLLESGGQIVAIANDPSWKISVKHETRKLNRTCDEVLPVAIAVKHESGNSLDLASQKFEKYLRHVKQWRFHFTFSGVRGLGQSGAIQPYLKNREGKILAGEMQWKRNGRFVLLPGAAFDDPQRAISLVLDELIGTSSDIAAPSWAELVAIPGVGEVATQRAKILEQIGNFRAQEALLEARHKSLLEFRRLVYSDGDELEEIVRRSFEELGGTVIPKKYGTEEFILVHEGGEHLIEVKGATGSAALKHARQLMDNLLAAEEMTGSTHHGILIANAFRNSPPSERGKGDLVEFPGNVVQRATANGIALVTGADLLAAVCAKLEGRADGDAVLRKLAAGVGQVRLP